MHLSFFYCDTRWYCSVLCIVGAVWAAKMADFCVFFCVFYEKMADFCGFADIVVGWGSVFFACGWFCGANTYTGRCSLGIFVHVGCVAIWRGMVYHGVCGSGVQYLCVCRIKWRLFVWSYNNCL